MVIDERNMSVGHCWTDTDEGKSELFREMFVQVPLFLLEIPLGVTWNKTGVAAARS
jgi:hypothetical protein